MIISRKVKNAIEIVGVILTTLVVCLFMTVYAKTSDAFITILNGIMMVCIITGIGSTVTRYKKINKCVLILTLIYFLSRIISYKYNAIPITYGGSLMIQAFYLIGINRYLFGKEDRKSIVLWTFVCFDLITVLLCYFNYYFRRDYVVQIYNEYADKGLSFETNVFFNPNTAGLMTGAVIILCLAFVLNGGLSRKPVITLIPVAIINLYMLFFDTGCRAAQTGLVVTCLIIVILLAFKKLDSARCVISAVLLSCFLLLIPVFTIVQFSDNGESLRNDLPIEKRIDAISSGRYAIWKTAILSQKGHLLFGFGGHNNTVEKRKQFVESFDQEKVAESYKEANDHDSLHNGYLTMIVETGIIGAIAFLLLLLKRIWMIRGRFRDGNWHYMLLIYIFWVNLFEAKLINAIFFTGFLMMVLLMPNEEDNENECKVIPEAAKEEIKEAI